MTNPIISVHVSRDHIPSDSVWVRDDSYSCFVREWDGEKIVQRVVSRGEPSKSDFDNITPDASAEVLAQVAQYEAKLAAARQVQERERLAAIVEVGKTVIVTSGRKVAIGTIGKVFWMERGGYEKIGIALDDSKDERGRNANVAWTYLKNVRVVQTVTEEQETAVAAPSFSVQWETQEVASVNQHAWNDAIVRKVFFSGAATKEELQKEVNAKYPRQSSYGALRWRSGAEVLAVDEEEKSFTWQESVSLTD